MQYIRSAYIVATLPRSGSFLLCNILSSGSLGFPQEYGGLGDVKTWRDFHGFQHHVAYFLGYLRFSTTPNGVFGAKLMWPQFVAFCEDIQRYLGINGPGLEPLREILGPVQFVFLQRRDRLAQGISLVRAMQSGVWSSRTPGNGKEVVYKRSELQRAMILIERNTQLWCDFFARHNIAPFPLWYEDYESGDFTKVRAMLEWLNLPSQEILNGRQRVLSRQSDELSKIWRALYENGC